MLRECSCSTGTFWIFTKCLLLKGPRVREDQVWPSPTSLLILYHTLPHSLIWRLTGSLQVLQDSTWHMWFPMSGMLPWSLYASRTPCSLGQVNSLTLENLPQLPLFQSLPLCPSLSKIHLFLIFLKHLWVRSKLLAPDHIQGEGITQKVEIIEGEMPTQPVIAIVN